MALTGSYLDRTEFKARTVAPVHLVDGLHLDVTNRAPWITFVESRLVIETSRINSQLRKRYAAPFAAPVPEIVLGWLAAIVTPKLYERRGWDPADAQAVALLADAELARTELQQAADSVEGLFDLPLRQDSTSTGIARGGPRGYAEASPYEWTDVQRDRVRG